MRKGGSTRWSFVVYIIWFSTTLAQFIFNTLKIAFTCISVANIRMKMDFIRQIWPRVDLKYGCCLWNMMNSKDYWIVNCLCWCSILVTVDNKQFGFWFTKIMDTISKYLDDNYIIFRLITCFSHVFMRLMRKWEILMKTSEFIMISFETI